MEPADLARLHAACFTLPRPWSEAEFTGLLQGAGAFLIACPEGFVLGRVVADEAELLTLAVDPVSRRQGHARALLAAFEAEAARRGATRAFLEVAFGNAPARALYAAAGWDEAGLRRGYYHAADGTVDDAVILSRSLVTDGANCY